MTPSQRPPHPAIRPVRRAAHGAAAVASLLALALGMPPAAAFAASPRPPAKVAAQPRPSAPAPAAAPAGDNGLQTPDYKIETSETHWNFNSGDFTMPHRVKFSRPGTDATSDRASGNSKNGTATLYGDVVVHDSGNTPASMGKGAYNGSGPATLQCDQLDVDSKAKVYTATGHVRFSQGTRSGTADKAILNRATGQLHLEGDVHLSDNGSTVNGSSVDYNLNTKDVEIHGGPAIMTQPEGAQPPSPPGAPSKPPAKPGGKASSSGKASAKPSPPRPAPKARPASSPRPSAKP